MGVINMHAGYYLHRIHQHIGFIKGVAVSYLSGADFCLFWSAQNISGYKNKKRSHTFLLIVLHARAMVVENTMYPTSDNDDDINVSTVLPVQSKNYGPRKFPKHDDNIDDKNNWGVAVEEEGLQVDMHVIKKQRLH